MNSKMFLRIVGIWCLLFLPLSTYAASGYYAIDTSGNIYGNTGATRLYNDVGPSGTPWILNDATNSIFSPGGSGWQVLNTSSFAVSDITDLTYGYGTSAFIRTASGNYLMDANGNILGNTGATRAYQGMDAASSPWMLNDATNSIFSPGGSSWQVLNTSLFAVSDITDLTFGYGSSAFIRTANGNYLMDANGNILGNTGATRAYQGMGVSNIPWIFNDATNSIFSPGGSSWQVLNTGLFSVADITDVTYASKDYAFVAVKVAAPIPEPETYAMMLAGLGLLGMAGLRTKKLNA